MPLDADERELLESVERGEWRSTRGFAHQQTEYARRAAATLRKDRLMDIFTDDAGRRIRRERAPATLRYDGRHVDRPNSVA